MLDIYSPRRGFAIVPNDADELEKFTRYIYVGSAGNLVVVLASDEDEITFVAVPAGTLLPIRAKKVLTASTASNLVGLY